MTQAGTETPKAARVKRVKPEPELVETMGEASEAVATFEPPVVRLSNGKLYTVTRLNWIKFKQFYRDTMRAIVVSAAVTQGQVAALIQQATPQDGETAEQAASRIQATLLEEIDGFPELMTELVALTVPEIDDAEYEAMLTVWPYDDVLMLVSVVITVNFLDSAGVRRFLPVVGRALKLLGGTGAMTLMPQ